MKRKLECGGDGIIIVWETSAIICIFIRGITAVEISSLLSVSRGNRIRLTSTRERGGGFKLFCDSFSNVGGIFEEEVTNASGITYCDQ